MRNSRDHMYRSTPNIKHLPFPFTCILLNIVTSSPPPFPPLPLFLNYNPLSLFLSYTSQQSPFLNPPRSTKSMSFFPSLPPPPPPPFYTTSNGGMSATSQPQQVNDNNNGIYNAGFITSSSSTSSSSSSSSSYSSTSVTSSIVIISIVISSAIIISASIYILLRFLSRRRYSTADDVILSNTTSSSGYNTLDALPVFTFGSVNGNLTGGDCAVCLSKFEKEDQLRLLPLCCHAFHTHCIDAWLSTNQTCPLCRSTVYPTETDVLNKVLSVTENANAVTNSNNNSSSNGSSFRVEIGSVSRRRGVSEGGGRRSYSLGSSFEYIVEDGYEIPVDSVSVHRGGASDDKEEIVNAPPGERLEAEVGGGSGRNWLREYVDRLGSMSFRSSGRFFSGSSRRSDVVVPVNDDLEEASNRAGEDISELFRWISGV